MQIEDLKFLVAEKEVFHRDWLVAILTQLGARNILEVDDGQAALSALLDTTDPVDISLIELTLPGMDGMELIRHISKDSGQHAVIVVSGLDQSLLFSVETMSKAYGVELLGTVGKPATPESVLEKILGYEARQRHLRTYSAVPAMSLGDVCAGLDADQFIPMFQPKIDLVSGQVIGVEAFARWQHPKYGLLSPAAFIPVLEAEHAMSMLTSIIISKCAAACQAWRSQGIMLTVSINVSPSVLAIQDFAEQVIVFVASQDLPPSSLLFEVTETATVTNGAHFLENLTRLRMHGFGISVDDYGTGGSSLQQLIRIPFSELKIDRSFVSGAANNRALELVLSASLAVCNQLDRKSVAVGVETKQDWDFLVRLGCTYAQGYYIAKPMDAQALPVWMQEWALFF